jgi:hypothetical protein
MKPYRAIVFQIKMIGRFTLISEILSGLPQNGVLEGREILAGGETTGSYRMAPVLSGGAPVGAREASAFGTSPVRGWFSRPSRALAFSTMWNGVGPVVAPPAHISRASGTQSGPHSPLCGAPTAQRRSFAGLSPSAKDCGGLLANANAPACDAPHTGLCGPLFSRPSRICTPLILLEADD